LFFRGIKQEVYINEITYHYEQPPTEGCFFYNNLSYSFNSPEAPDSADAIPTTLAGLLLYHPSSSQHPKSQSNLGLRYQYDAQHSYNAL
jgi:hypothetical protein